MGPVVLLAALALALTATATAAQPPEAAPAQTKRHVDIAAGTLDAALNSYASATGMLLAIDGQLTRGKVSAGLNGDYVVLDGLNALLAGTGLEARVQPGGAYTLRKGIATQATPLPQVLVAAKVDSVSSPPSGDVATMSSTASKTETPLSETPFSLTVVTRQQMLEQGANSVQGALGYAAGVRSDAYGLDTRSDGMRVRGSTPVDYVDGVRKTFGFFTTSSRTEPYALERIDVLRGAAAMLYGQGTTGGVINMLSKRPQAESRNEVGLEYGSWQRRQVNADFTGALTADGEWLYRLVVLERKANTQVDSTRDDRTLVAPSLTWKPNAATSLTLQASHQDDRTTPTQQFLPWRGLLTDNPNGKIAYSRFVGEPGLDYYNIKRTTAGWLFEHAINNDWTLRQNAHYSSNHVDYQSVYGDPWTLAGGFAGDAVNQRLLGRYADGAVNKTKLFSIDHRVEGHFATGGLRHQVLIGFDYTRFKQSGSAGSDYPEYAGGAVPSLNIYNPVYSGYAGVAMTPIATNRQVQSGIYVQDQLHLTPQWLLMAGLRHDRANNATADAATEKTGATTKRAGLMYLAGNGWSPYLSYSESFSPVANSARGQRFQPLRGKQWEGGVKYQPAGGTVLFNAAAYDWREMHQLVALTPDVYQQLGRTHTRGLELEARGEMAPHLDVIAHYNYIAIDPQLEAIPRHQAAAWAKYRFSVAGMPGFSFGAGVRYMSHFRDGAAPVTPSVTLLDSLLGWENTRWRVALNINNLANRSYISTCLSRGDCWLGEQRNAVLSARYRW